MLPKLKRNIQIAVAAIVAALGLLPANAGSFYLSPVAGQDYVASQGAYVNHLQGISTNGSDAIYWSFTDKLLKTDTAGRIIKSVNVLNHHGDLTYANGKIYVAVNDMTSNPPGEFNVANPINPQRQWIYQYDAGTLAETARYRVPELTYGAGGIAFHNEHFLVVGGLAEGQTKNYAYEYDMAFNLVKTHVLLTGYTFRGIQTAEFAHGHWWFGTYDSLDGNSSSRQLLKFNESLSNFSQHTFDAALGIAALPDGNFLIGKNIKNNDLYVGRVQVAALHNTKGLQLIPIPVPEPKGLIFILSALILTTGIWLFINLRRTLQATKQLLAILQPPWIRHTLGLQRNTIPAAEGCTSQLLCTGVLHFGGSAAGGHLRAVRAQPTQNLE